DLRQSQNLLEETIFHECVHATLQMHTDESDDGFTPELGIGALYTSESGSFEGMTPDWLAAIQSDKAFISVAGADNMEQDTDGTPIAGSPDEDFAETITAVFPLMRHPERFTQQERNVFDAQIPGRVAFIETLFPKQSGLTYVGKADDTSNLTTYSFP